MSTKELFSKYKKPLIIMVVLFFLAFSIRAEAAAINGVPADQKSYYEDAAGLPFYSEMDSYYNFRMTEDFLAYGHLGDTIENGIPWDLHSTYPPGKSAQYPPLIAYLTAVAYKVVDIFGAVPLTNVAFWMGAFVASLAVIPAYLFVRRITNDYGGVMAGILIGLAPAYVSHTFAGFFDTDQFAMILPILVVWFFAESVLAKNLRNRTSFAILSAFFMLVYSAAWEGWWYIFYLVIGSAIVYLIVSNYLLNLKADKPSAEDKSTLEKFKLGWFSDKPVVLSLVIFLVISLILMTISIGPAGLYGAIITEPMGVSSLQSTVAGSSYPNVYISVSELQPATFAEVVSGVGGYLPFIFGFLGIVALIFGLRTQNSPKKEIKKARKPRRRGRSRRKNIEETTPIVEKTVEKSDIPGDKRKYLFYLVMFAIWIAVIGYAVTQGIRFVENFALPLGLSAAIFVGMLVPYVKDHVPNVSYQKIVMGIIIVAVAFSPITTAYGITSTVVPGTDESMVSSLQWISNNTSNNTIITSWWDFGHLFTAVANRPVTFDGSSQDSPSAYWVGEALLTSNETLSAGILRMLASSGDSAPETLDNMTNNTGKSVQILNSILGVNRTQALSIMTTQYGLTQSQAQTIAQYTHPANPAPHVFITSPDMVDKAGWWSYFGSWNFTSGNGTNYQYVASPMNATTVNNNTLLVGQNAVVAQANGTGYSAGIINTNAITTNNTSETLDQISNELETGNGSLLIQPHELILINNNTVTSQIVSNSSQYSIILINENNTYIAVAMNSQLENSMFTRMFFESGAGLTLFKPAYTNGGDTVWNVTSY